MEKKERKTLLWHTHADDDDNTYIEAASPYSSDGESVNINWRLRQRIRDDKIVWLADHDDELEPTGDEETEWSSMSAATEAIQKYHNKIIEAAKSC